MIRDQKTARISSFFSVATKKAQYHRNAQLKEVSSGDSSQLSHIFFLLMLHIKDSNNLLLTPTYFCRYKK